MILITWGWVCRHFNPFPSFWILTLLSHLPRGAENSADFHLSRLNLILVIGLLPVLNQGPFSCLVTHPPSPRNPVTLLQLPNKLLEVTFGSGRYLAIGTYCIFLSNHYVQMCCFAELESLIWIKTRTLETLNT